MSYTVQAAEPNASATVRGVVSTGAQTFAGDKTFTGKLVSTVATGPAFRAGVGAANYVIQNGTEWGIWTNGGGAGGGSIMNFALPSFGGALQLISSEGLVTPWSYRSDIGSGSDAFRASAAGARWKIGPGTVDYFTSDGASCITAGGSLNAGSEGYRIGNNYVLMNGSPHGLDPGMTLLRGNIANVADVVGVGIGNQVPFTASGAQVAAFYNGAFGTKVAAIDKSGSVISYVADGAYLLRTATVATGIWRNAGATQLIFDVSGATLLTLQSGFLIFNGEIRSVASSGSNAFSAVTGARWAIGGGTTDYLASNGSTKITAAGDFAVTGTLSGATADLTIATRLIGAASSGNAILTLDGSIGSQLEYGNNLLRCDASRPSVNMGSANPVTQRAAIGGLAFISTTAVGNVGGAGPDDLISYQLPASALSANGKGIIIKAWGTFPNNGNAKTVALVVGGTTLETKQLTANAAGTWEAEAIFVRTGSNAQDFKAMMINDIGTTLAAADGPTVQRQATFGTAAETDTNAITIKGQATVCTADNDVVMEGMAIWHFNQ